MQELPIDALLPLIRERLRRERALVIQAPPGAGKTTRVPPALMADVRGEILVLEPRRLAARLAARRVAAELGERAGETAGYQVRFEEVAGSRTRIRFMTEGVLTRRLMSDPGLRGVSAVLLDEFHERRLEGDLALALLRRLQRTARPDLRLAVMSATLDAGPVAAYLGAGEPVRSEGRLFDLSISYTPASADAPEQQVTAGLERLLREGLSGDVLVFLPGAAEIRRAARACAPIAARRGLLVLPLHGDLTPEEQDRAVQPGPMRKVILSTNVAESSVTIEGVTAVVDSGLARLASQSPWSGLPRLTVTRVSRASADQRAGRAGRVAPGRVIRLYSEEDYLRRPAQELPEVARAELSQVVLELAMLGAEGLEWLGPPPEGALNRAGELLRRLGALGPDGRPTAAGERMARTPLHPRLARLILDAGSAEGCKIAAVLSAGDRLPGGDLLSALDCAWEPHTRKVYEQIRRLIQAGPPDDRKLRRAVLAAFPDRVARRRRGNELLLSTGGSALLAGDGPPGEFLVAVDVEERSDRDLPLVRLAAAIEPDWLIEQLEERVSLEWNRTAERVEEARQLVYDELVVDETRGAPSDAEAAAAMLAERALAAGVGRFADPDELEALLARISFAGLPEPHVGEVLVSLCRGLRSFAELRAVTAEGGLERAIKARLPARLDESAPERIRLPGGKHVRVNYQRGQAPWVAAKLQEFFGMTESPRAAGRPIVVRLLAPNNRPVQTTTDLAGFWQRLYPEVRRELSRRYPRHRWPENPLEAAPGERTR